MKWHVVAEWTHTQRPPHTRTYKKYVQKNQKKADIFQPCKVHHTSTQALATTAGANHLACSPREVYD